jgi:hypothetical protein
MNTYRFPQHLHRKRSAPISKRAVARQMQQKSVNARKAQVTLKPPAPWAKTEGQG